MTERLLFTAEEPRRFFLVPRERLDRSSADALAEGELELRALDGASYSLSAIELAVHEVDRDRAVAHVDAGVERVLGPLLDWLDQPSVRLFGVSAGEVLVDPEKRREARRSLLERAGRLVRPELSDADIANAEQQLDSLGQTLSRETHRWAVRLEEQRPVLEAVVETAEHRVVALGQQLRDAFRSLSREAARRPDEDRED